MVADVVDSVKLTVGGVSLTVLTATALLEVNPLMSVAFTYTWNVAVGLDPVEE